MSLTGALHVGRSALNASQVAIQVTGNNFANAATPGYSRQIVSLAPSGGQRFGNSFVGRGVQLAGVSRQIDQAIQDRLWNATAQQASAQIDLSVLTSLETTLNELSEADLSSELSRFFNSWSELANSPTSEGARSLVIRQGSTLAGFVRTLRSDLSAQRDQIDAQLTTSVSRADDLLGQIALLNGAIVASEVGSAQDNSLRDQRDALVSELSEYLDVNAIEQPSGAVNVLVGSTPVVLGSTSRGVEVQTRVENGDTTVSVVVSEDRRVLDVAPEHGSVGALLEQRGQTVDAAIDRLDSITSQLIFQVNRAHSVGYGTSSITSVRSSLPIEPVDTSRAFNDPANTSFADLPFRPVNGSFTVTVTNSATGSSQTVVVDIDLDGRDSAGAAGFADDTSVEDIRDAINAIPNLSATVNADGTLSVSAAAGYRMNFSEDSSGVLAVLGVNTYFTGTDATDIAINSTIEATPGLLATGYKTISGDDNDNAAALAISLVQDQPLDALGGLTIRGAWVDTTQDLAVRTGAARTRADATALVKQSLESQRAGVSGVSTDEEAINLITYQRQYQGAARFISAVDELTQTLLSII